MVMDGKTLDGKLFLMGRYQSFFLRLTGSRSETHNYMSRNFMLHLETK